METPLKGVSYARIGWEKAMANMPVGYVKQYRELSGGAPCCVWTVKRLGRVVAEGSEPTKARAEVEANKAIISHMDKQGGSAKAKRDSMRWLREKVQQRPYLMLGMLQLMLHGVGKAGVVAQARKLEAELWKSDKAKNKPALPTHHLALSPEDCAARAWGEMANAGMLDAGEDGPKPNHRLRKFAVDLYGEEAFK